MDRILCHPSCRPECIKSVRSWGMYIENLVERGLFSESFPVRIEYNRWGHFEYPAHWHKAVEVVFAAKAACQITVNQHLYTLKEGDLVFIAAGDVHSFPLSARCEQVIILFDLDKPEGNGLSGEEVSLLSKSVLITRDANVDLHCRMKKIIKNILREATDMKPGFRWIIMAGIYELVTMVIRNTKDYEPLEGSIKKDLLHKVGKVVEYLEKNHMKQITLKSAALEAGFSDHYLSRIFSQVMGISCHAYLNRIRIKQAESRLLQNEESISEIAYNSGFGSLSTFNRVFLKAKGCTPLQYRKMYWDHHRTL